MSAMRRALVRRQSRFVYFLLLILCIPVTEKDDNLPKHQDKWRFFCKQSDLYEHHPASSFILESFVAKDSSSPAEPNQTLNKTLWALKVDREVWHGELINTQHGELALNALLPHEDSQWSRVENSSRSLQAALNLAPERAIKDAKGMLVVHCNPRNSIPDSMGSNQSIQGKCLRASQVQTSISTIAEEAPVEKVKVLMSPSPDVLRTMAFHLHNQCSWPHESHTGSAVLSFFHQNKEVQNLELDFNSTLLPSLKHNTLKERINRLLDERITRYACSQGMSKEFIAKNTRSLPLRVHSLMIKGVSSEMHGFKVEFFGDFYLGPGQSTRFHVSYQPDLKIGMADGELQLLTSAGMLSMTLKANVPNHIQCLCQNAALIARAKKIILQVCSLALFIVLLVFGRMLKQEGLIMSNGSQWSSASSTAKLSQRANGRSMHYHDNNQSSIYVSIDIGCTHNESKQCSLSLTKALDFVNAAINCIVGMKLLYISHSSNAQQREISITSKGDLHTQLDNDTSSPTSSMIGKRRASTHLRACSKPASTPCSGRALALRSKACSQKKTESQLDVTSLLEKTEPNSPSAAHSDKENEKSKQRKKKKGAPLAPGMETGSDSGSSSPLSMPSSPVIREVLCRPVSPLSSGVRTSMRKCKMPVEMDAEMMNAFDKDGHKMSRTHCLLDNGFPLEENSMQKTKDNFICEESEAYDLHAAHARNFFKSINQEGRTLEAKPVVKPSESNLVKVVTVRNSSKSIATTRPRGATLTTSATFPAPGQRCLQERESVVEEDGHYRSIVWSSSTSDLVSTSVVAPHARAPGSPLSPKSPTFSRNTLSSSPFTPPIGNRQYMQQGSPMFNNRSGQRCDFKGKAQHTQEMFYHNASGASSPRHMHGPHYAQKRQDPHHKPESVILYDIWGDHFADLGRRWGPHWIGKEAPITRKPSSLPPLLQTPPFSVFSCNDPFSR